jgi:hypothetical protein
MLNTPARRSEPRISETDIWESNNLTDHNIQHISIPCRGVVLWELWRWISKSYKLKYFRNFSLEWFETLLFQNWCLVFRSFIKMHLFLRLKSSIMSASIQARPGDNINNCKQNFTITNRYADSCDGHYRAWHTTSLTISRSHFWLSFPQTQFNPAPTSTNGLSLANFPTKILYMWTKSLAKGFRSWFDSLQWQGLFSLLPWPDISS